MTSTRLAERNVALYPWFRFCHNLLFWQAIWFLYFQDRLSAAEAILLYAVYDVATTALEVPSGYMSDRLGRRVTLIASALAGCAGATLLALGDSFLAFAAGQVLLGASTAFLSGTDSALLYESLAMAGRKSELERQELRAWRFSFVALAISAVLGGILALGAAEVPFLASAVASAGGLAIALRFGEPKHAAVPVAQGAEVMRLRSLGRALTQPVLMWLFALSLLMYVFSHVPFVFGQPFILEALRGTGFEAEAPLVSGSVSAVMMVISVSASLVAVSLRRTLGLPVVLLLAFGMQIALCAALMLSDAAAIVGLLFLRMVPDALSQPFILARTQPLLGDESRATYLSLKSLTGRLLFASTLYLASFAAPGEGQLAYPALQQVLGWYVAGGTLCLMALAVAAARLRIDAPAAA